jgi:hypothetical protein
MGMSKLTREQTDLLALAYIESLTAENRALRKRAGLDDTPILNTAEADIERYPLVAKAIGVALQRRGNTGPKLPPQDADVQKAAQGDTLEAAILKSLQSAGQDTSLPLDHRALMQQALDGLEAAHKALEAEHVAKERERAEASDPVKRIRRAVQGGSDFGLGGPRR